MVKIREFLAVDRRALVSEHAFGDAIGGTLNLDEFTEATHYPKGVIPALTPVSQGADGLCVPYDPLVGALRFTVNPVDVTGDLHVALLWHGVIDPTLLPVDFDSETVDTTSATKFEFTKA